MDKMNLSEAEREELMAMQRSRTMAVGQVRRARLILLLDKRDGTLSLVAALNTATGEVLGKTASRHTSAQFVAFLTEVMSAHRTTQEIHVICDNVSSHKTPAVHTFLLDHPNVPMHYTPT